MLQNDVINYYRHLHVTDIFKAKLTTENRTSDDKNSIK